MCTIICITSFYAVGIKSVNVRTQRASRETLKILGVQLRQLLGQAARQLRIILHGTVFRGKLLR